jgi:hypothetical protein
MRLLVRAVAAGFFALGCSSPTPAEPCLRWVHPGESYDIKLGTPEAIPIDPQVLPIHSCGSVDLKEGFTVKLQTLAMDSASPTCMPTRATTSNISAVTLGDAGDAGISAINPGAEAEYPHATVVGGCRAIYRLGLNDETDSVLRAYRYFSTDTPTQCASAGFNVSADQPYCWDSWRVVVKDSQGNVVASSD